MAGGVREDARHLTYSVPEASKRTGINAKKLRKAIREGRLAAITGLGPRSTRISAAALDAFVRGGQA